MAFALVGVKGKVCETREKVLDAFLAITGQTASPAEVPRVLILSETAAAMIEDEELLWQKGARYPLIVEVPSMHGHIPGRKTLSQAISEAIGVSV